VVVKVKLWFLKPQVAQGPRRHDLTLDVARLRVVVLANYEDFLVLELLFQPFLFFFLACVECVADSKYFISVFFIADKRSLRIASVGHVEFVAADDAHDRARPHVRGLRVPLVEGGLGEVVPVLLDPGVGLADGLLDLGLAPGALELLVQVRVQLLHRELSELPPGVAVENAHEVAVQVGQLEHVEAVLARFVGWVLQHKGAL